MAGDAKEILDLIHESIVVRDQDNRIVFWNRASEQLYGLDRHTVIGQEFRALLCIEEDAAVAAAKKTLLANGKWEGELRRRAADGRELLIDVRWAIRRDDAGAILGVIETGRDITARRAAEERLRYSEHRYHNLFQAMAASFWEIDFSGVDAILRALHRDDIRDFRAHFAANPDLVRRMLRAARVIDVNDQTVAMFGRGNKGELLGNLEPFWPPESVHVFVEGILQGMAGQRSYVVETRLRTIDGRLFDALFTASYPPDTMGKGTLVIGVIDISGRKHAEDQLRRSELRYRNVFSAMPIALWQVNVAGTAELMENLRASGVTDLEAWLEEHPHILDDMRDLITVEEVNEQTVRLFGEQSPDDHGNVNFFRPQDQGPLRRALAARFRGEDSYTEEMRALTLDGSIRDVVCAMAFSPQLTETGINIIGAVDITDRVQAQAAQQQLQEELAHASRISMLGELTASIAHEVNQPLAAIATNAEAALRWLNRDTPDLDEVRQLATRSIADVRRAADIIARIRAMAAHRAPEHAPAALNAIVEEAWGFLRHEMRVQGVALALDLSPAAPTIIADRVQIQQVVVNLLVNAMQAADGRADKRITISTVAGPETVQLRVDDNGPGIPADVAARLFESFFTTKPGGMGMGLPICRSIVESHGGTIAYQPHPEGGASFIVHLHNHTKV